ncbi:MAG: HIT family protein [Aquirufa sp.]|jgi:histidine triad (HIT) family protein
MSTIFTKIVNKEIPCHLIKEDDRFLAFLDVMPLVEGHVLVIPKQEVDYIFDLAPELLGDLMKFAQTIAPAIKKAIPCKRVGVAVIGLEVPHAHVHLVPMNRMLDINFSQEKMKPSAESLAKTAELIRSFLL